MPLVKYSADFLKLNCFKKVFEEYHQSVKQVESRDQVRHFVEADLGPNCGSAVAQW